MSFLPLQSFYPKKGISYLKAFTLKRALPKGAFYP